MKTTELYTAITKQSQAPSVDSLYLAQSTINQSSDVILGEINTVDLLAIGVHVDVKVEMSNEGEIDYIATFLNNDNDQIDALEISEDSFYDYTAQGSTTIEIIGQCNQQELS